MATYVTQEMLAEARAAYHRIATGGGIYQFRDQNGEQVSYSRTNLADLAKYIQWLERQLNPRPSGPMRAWM